MTTEEDRVMVTKPLGKGERNPQEGEGRRKMGTRKETERLDLNISAPRYSCAVTEM